MSFEKITDHLMGYELEEANVLISQLPDSKLGYARVFNAELMLIKGEITEAYNLCTNILENTDDLIIRFASMIVNMGVTHFLGKFDEMLVLSKEAEETHNLMNQDQKHKIRKWYPLLFNWRGNLGNQISNREEAMNNFFKAIELYKELEPPTRISNTYQNVAATYISMGRLDDGYQILKQSQDMDHFPANSMDGFFTPLTFGVYYRLIGDDDKAITYYEKALARAIDLQNDFLKLTSYSTLMLFYVDLGDRQKAKEYLNHCLRIGSTISYD